MRDLPSRDDILDFIRDNPQSAGKREIARAFNVKGGQRVELKALLREMEDEGLLERKRRRVRPPGALPPVAVLVAEGPDADGDLFARPEDGAEGVRVILRPQKRDPAIGRGDRLLVKVRAIEGDGAASHEGRLIKKIGAGGRRLLGIYREGAEGGRVVPVEKKAPAEWMIPAGAEGGARDGELVEAEQTGGPRFGLPKGRIVARLGDPGAPKQVSLIALHQHGIPYAFPDDVLAEAQAAEPVETLDAREDLRHLPLVTIDPADARDHDDAVCAIPRADGGWTVWVAIADVAHYVRSGTALDREARARGNSTYFPDRVAPMLPERLSADLCSLMEGVERPCLAVAMEVEPDGRKSGHRFVRGLMRSPAALAYEAAQGAIDGAETAGTAHLDALRALWDAWAAVMRARAERQPLDLDLPERKVMLAEDGTVASVDFRERLDAHRVIEEFMILANVAAAETLEEARRPLLYRVHEEPAPEKVDQLRETLAAVGLTLPKGQALRPRHLNFVLDAAAGTGQAEDVNLTVLRAQTQAYYNPENYGHFGLNLRRYAHFTSPIRRYADLVVHRAILAALGAGPRSLPEPQDLRETAEHISMTERRSMEAERDTVDRYLAAFLADQRGAEFAGRVSGVTKAGLFVKLDDTGADGLIPISTLGREYFRYDAESRTLTGEDTGTTFALGQRVRVRLVEATPVSGGLILELREAEGAGRRQSSGTGRRPGGRRVGAERAKRAKATRKARRGR